jgi:hypothetical protein
MTRPVDRPARRLLGASSRRSAVELTRKGNKKFKLVARFENLNLALRRLLLQQRRTN